LRLTYDDTGFLNKVTDAAGHYITLTKGASGRVSQVSDNSGRVLRYEYDTSGNLVKFTDPIGRVTLYSYDANHNLLTVRDPRGAVVQNAQYDSQDRVVRFLEGGVSYSVTYSPDQKKSVKRDPAGGLWTYNYDASGAITRRSDPIGNAEQFEFDAKLNVTASTNRNGHKTQCTYDAKGNPLSVSDSNGDRIQFAYEPRFSFVERTIDAVGNAAHFSYDSRGNLLQFTDAAGHRTTLTYDGRGMPVSLSEPGGAMAQFGYNSRGELIGITAPDNSRTAIEYDDVGRILRVVDGNGSSKEFSYDGNDRILSFRDAKGGQTSFDYDESGNLIKLTDARGNATTFSYDALGHRKTKVDPLGHVETYEYDSMGNLSKLTDRNGSAISFRRDALGRLMALESPGATCTFAYDAAGNILEAQNAVSRLQFEYDHRNHVKKEVMTDLANGSIVSLEYAYDARDNLSGITDSFGNTYSFLYDSRGQLIAASTGEATVTATYTPNGRIKKLVRGNGVATEFGYDVYGRLVSLVDSVSGPNLLSPVSLSYDATQRVAGIGNNSAKSTFLFDENRRLVGVKRDAEFVEQYEYDATGNRVKSHRSGLYRCDGANRLLETDTRLDTYDANGNLISRADKTTGKTTVYSYDSENQLVRIEHPSGEITVYQYDALGRRILKDHDGTKTRYVYAGDDILLELNTAGQITQRYLHGSGVDEPLAMVRSEGVFYFHTNHQGSVRAVSDAQGHLVGSYGYDSFGNVTERDGLDSPFLFAGREYDGESGFYYMRARFYDPAIGRFVQEDPVALDGGDTNFYAYVSNDPINFNDPFGLWTGPDDIVTGPVDEAIVGVGLLTLYIASKLGSESARDLLERLRDQFFNDDPDTTDDDAPDRVDDPPDAGFCPIPPASDGDDHRPKKRKNEKYRKPDNPNRRKGADNRQKTGERERNVGHPEAEEHSRRPKGGFRSR
jgi:RHS repeat-associated protein